MTILAICSALIGSLAGFRYRVVVLPPLIGFGAGALIAFGMTHGISASQVIWSVLVFAIPCQFGYVGGLIVSHAVAPAHRPALLSIKSAD